MPLIDSVLLLLALPVVKQARTVASTSLVEGLRDNAAAVARHDAASGLGDGCRRVRSVLR